MIIINIIIIIIIITIIIIIIITIIIIIIIIIIVDITSISIIIILANHHEVRDVSPPLCAGVMITHRGSLAFGELRNHQVFEVLLKVVQHRTGINGVVALQALECAAGEHHDATCCDAAHRLHITHGSPVQS
jgi:hypothetical protein